ncbi:unnamed protein product, partial [Didymodactylos carnosus]
HQLLDIRKQQVFEEINDQKKRRCLALQKQHEDVQKIVKDSEILELVAKEMLLKDDLHLLKVKNELFINLAEFDHLKKQPKIELCSINNYQSYTTDTEAFNTLRQQIEKLGTVGESLTLKTGTVA